MTRKEHLEFCKKCKNRQTNTQKGIICKLTQEIADFDPVCNNFQVDEAVANKPEVVYTENPGTISLQANVETIRNLRQYQDFYYALIGGFLAAIIGGIIWAVITVATKYQIGYMAIGVGFLVGQSVGFFGAGVDKKFGVLGSVLSLFGCVLGNLLSQVGFIAQSESMTYFEVISYLNFPLVKSLMTESFNAMDVLFYGIAIFEGYKFAFRKVSNHMVKEMNDGKMDFKPAHQKIRMPLTVISIVVISYFGFKIFSGVSGPKKFYYESGAILSEGEMKHSKEDGHWIYYYENGNKQVEADYKEGVMTGEWKWYDENGVLTKAGQYEDGLESGSWIAYYAGGNMSDSCGYKASRMDGFCKSWYEDGTLAQQGGYDHNMESGKWTYYYPDGRISSEGFMKDGVQSGIWKDWFENGAPYSEINYVEDGIVRIINAWDNKGKQIVKEGNGQMNTYYVSGGLYETGNVKDGNKTGIWKTYFETGSLQEEVLFEDSQPKIKNVWNTKGEKIVTDGNGMFEVYYPGTEMVSQQGMLKNGLKEGVWSVFFQTADHAKMMEIEYHNGAEDGAVNTYYQSGQISSSGINVNGKKEGEWKWYYESGVLSSVVSYKNDKKDGVQQLYSEMGELSKEEEYKDGELINEGV